MSHSGEVQDSMSGPGKARPIMKADKKHNKKVATVKLHISIHYSFTIHLHKSIFIYHRLLISNCLGTIQVSLIHFLYFMAQEGLQGFKKSIYVIIIIKLIKV